MCNIRVIESVKQRMLTRRSLLKGVAAGTVTAGGLGALVPLAQAMNHGAVSDMTHELHEGFPTFGGDQQLFMDHKLTFADDGYNLFELRVNEHTGTHLDAPLHFSADGASVAEIPVSDLVCPLCVIDIREKASTDADAQLTPDDLKAWMDEHGEIPDNACVAMNSGWARHVDSDRYRNADADGMHFPGFHPEAAQLLLDETRAAGIAVDTLSLDHGQSTDFAVHYAWLPAGRWGLECIANLDKVPAAGATLVVGAPKIRGGTGGPSRVFAMS